MYLVHFLVIVGLRATGHWPETLPAPAAVVIAWTLAIAAVELLARRAPVDPLGPPATARAAPAARAVAALREPGVRAELRTQRRAAVSAAQAASAASVAGAGCLAAARGRAATATAPATHGRRRTHSAWCRPST